MSEKDTLRLPGLNLGLSPDESGIEARRQRLTNGALLLALVSSSAFIAAGLLLNPQPNWGLTGLFSAFGLLILGGLGASAARQFQLSRWLLNLGISTQMITVLSAHGAESGLGLFFLLFALVPFLVWELGSWGPIALFVTLNLGAYGLFTWILPGAAPDPLPEGLARIFQTLAPLTVFGIFVTLVLIFQGEARRREQALLQLNALKDQFLQIIAHDLRNPLGSFTTLLSFLNDPKQGTCEDDRSRALILLQESSDKLMRLLENLLAWATTQRGEFPFHPQELPLTAALADLQGLLSSQAEAKGVQLSWDLSSPVTVTADAAMLRSMVQNLVGNAVKFTPRSGQIRVWSETEGPLLRLYVEDSGIGIPPETAARLFKIGQKTSRRGTAGESGSGLGLLLTQAFAERHGGRLDWAPRNPGTCFTLSLPR